MKKIGLNFLESQEPFQVHLGFLKFWRIVDSTSGKLTAKFDGDDSYLKSSKTVKVVIK